MALPEWFHIENDWHEVIRAERLKTDQPFLVVEVDHGGDARDPELSWWRVPDLTQNLHDLVCHFLRHPGTRGPLHGHGKAQNTVGALNTLAVIHQFGPRSVMPAMVAASLEGIDLEATGLSAAQAGIFDEIRILSHAWFAGTGLQRSPWAYPIKSTLPQPTLPGQRLQPGGAKIDFDLPGLFSIADHAHAIRWLATRHAAFFKTWQAVEIRFTSNLSPRWKRTRDTIAKNLGAAAR